MNAVVMLKCPICRGSLAGGVLEGVCPACAWVELGETPDSDGTLPSDGLFRVPGHDVIAEIARGGAGIVYRARQREPRRDVALKMLLPQQLGSAEMRARFRLEAETIAALDHPAILPVYTVGEYEGLPYFTMKLATGGTLAARRLAFEQQWRKIAVLVARLADAVHFAHTRGVIHRDVKPANVLFDDAGGAYVSDFGLAKFTAATDGPTLSINVLGTPAYLAPEVIEHGAASATTAGDVYGLGAIFYELLAGRVPFAADTLPALLREVTERTPERPSRLAPRVPRDLEVICLRCLDKDPGKRLASAGELADDLRRWLEGRPIHARPVTSAERSWRWARRNPALATLSALLSVAVVGGGVALWRANRELTAALVQARRAENDATDKLRQALLVESRLTRQSGHLGQHFDALALAERAGKIAPTVEARSETAAALAKPDLALERTLPGFFPSRLTSADFAPDLSGYLSALPEGGLVLRNGGDGEILRRYALPRNTTASIPRFAESGKFFSVILSDFSTVFWDTERLEPVWVLPSADSGVAKSALHPRVPLVAYRGSAHEVIVRDLRDGTERQLLGGGERVYALSFDPEGRRLVVVRRGNASVVDVDTGAVRWSVADDHIGLAPPWSADGKRLATANSERNEIVVRDADDGRAVSVLFGHTTLPAFIGFWPDGRRLVSMALDGTVRLWDVTSGRELLTAMLPTRGLRVAPDGRRIGAASDSATPAIFSWAPETVFREMTGGSDGGASTTAMDISRDGAWVLTGIRYETKGRVWIQRVRLWDARRGIEVATFTFPEQGFSTAKFQPDARAIVYGGTQSGLHRRTFAEGADGVVRLGDEETLGANRDGLLLGFDRAGNRWFIHRPKVNRVVIWPDGRADQERDYAVLEPGENAGVSPDGRWLATSTRTSRDLRLRTIDGAPGPIRTLTLERESIYFSADSRSLLIAGERGFRIWDLTTWQAGPAWTTRADGEPVRTASFSPDGRYLVTEVTRGTVELREAKTFGLLLKLEPPMEIEASRFAWAPDNSRVYLLGRGPRLFYWDLVALRTELAKRGLDWKEK